MSSPLQPPPLSESLPDLSKTLPKWATCTGLPTDLPPPYNDEQVLRHGFSLVFNNKVGECLEFFRLFKGEVPIFTHGYALILSLSGLLTQDKDDMATALAAISASETLADKHRKAEGVIGGLGRWMTGGKRVETEEMTACHVISAECKMAHSAMLIMTESDSFLQLVKAALSIKCSWDMYKLVHSRMGTPDEPGMDGETLSAMYFGVGAMNLFISVLPAKIIKVLNWVGFPSDQKLAFEYLAKAGTLGGVRQPLALLSLLLYHVMVPAFFGPENETHIKLTEDLLQASMERFPDGFLHLIMRGRHRRMKRDLEGAIEDFKKSVAAQDYFHHVHHVCAYEQGMTHLYQCDYARAYENFNYLREKSDWSELFYTYMTAITALQIGKTDEGYTLLRSMREMDIKTIGGKKIAVEKFVMQRIDRYLDVDGDDLHAWFDIGCVEIVNVWNGLYYLDEHNLAVYEKQVVSLMKKHVTLARASPDFRALGLLLEGTIEKARGDYVAATAIFDRIEMMRKDVTTERYVVPYQRYERVSMACQRAINDPDECGNIREMLETADHWATKADAYNHKIAFDLRLRIRLHLAKRCMKRLKAAAA